VRERPRVVQTEIGWLHIGGNRPHLDGGVAGGPAEDVNGLLIQDRDFAELRLADVVLFGKLLDLSLQPVLARFVLVPLVVDDQPHDHASHQAAREKCDSEFQSDSPLSSKIVFVQPLRCLVDDVDDWVLALAVADAVEGVV